MKDLIINYLPWLLSANTIYFTLLAGNNSRHAWLLALIGQVFWMVWVVASEAWGLVPMNIALWVIYGRNYLKWK